MSTVAALTAVISIAVVTYFSRAGLIVLLADRPLPTNLSRALRYVGPAVLSALCVNLLAGGAGVSGVEAEETTAVGVGIVVAVVTRNLVASLTAGMLAMWLLLWLL